MTTPTDFVLWLNGATGVMGDSPTPEQWEAIKEKLNESLGFLAAKKLLERAEDQIVRDRELEAKRKEEMEMDKMKAQFANDIAKHQLLQDEAVRNRQLQDRMKMYPGPMIGAGQPFLGEPAKVMGLYDPALAPKAVLGALRADACVSDKSDDRMDAIGMAMNYAKEAK